MAEFPALPLFTDAYLADTRHLTAAQHGAYLLLLMTAWRTPDCALPNDDGILARWAAMDVRNWMKTRDVVMAFWCLGEDGKWRQGRLSDERKYVASVRAKKASAGIASALKRKNRDSTSVPTEVQQDDSTHTHTHTHIQTTTTTAPSTPQLHPISEFPATAAAIRKRDPGVDDLFVRRLAAETIQACLSDDSIAPGEVDAINDSWIADAVEESYNSFTGKKHGIGLLLSRVPMILRGWCEKVNANA